MFQHRNTISPTDSVVMTQAKRTSLRKLTPASLELVRDSHVVIFKETSRQKEKEAVACKRQQLHEVR